MQKQKAKQPEMGCYWRKRLLTDSITAKRQCTKQLETSVTLLESQTVVSNC